MRILVTGGMGYLGQPLVAELSKSNEVVVLDSLVYARGFVPQLYRPDVQLIVGDIRDQSVVELAMRDVDFVYNLAALVGEAACRADHVRSEAVNVEGLRVVAGAAARRNAPLVSMSTCSVLDHAQHGASSERDISIYARQKLAGEQAVREIEQASGWIVRLASLFGFAPRHRLDLVINSLCYAAALGRPLSLFGSGSEIRPFISVNDAAAVLSALTRWECPKGVETIYVGREQQNLTIAEVARAISSVSGAIIARTDYRDISDRRSYRVAFPNEKAFPTQSIAETFDSQISDLIIRSRDVRTAFSTTNSPTSIET